VVNWAQRLLFLGVFLFLAGALLRLCGYNQGYGFLQGVGFIAAGITPRAFLMAGGVCGVFSIAFGVLGIGRILERRLKDPTE
jgi:hypothetical protein